MSKPAAARRKNYPVVSLHEAHKFIKKCFIACEFNKEVAKLLADVLMFADTRGFYANGMFRLDGLIRTSCLLHNSHLAPVPTIIRESKGTALVDGNNNLGPIAGFFCMNLAIQKAKECGIGWVICKGCGTPGLGGYYNDMANSERLIGMTFSSHYHLMCPTRAKHPSASPSPFSLSAPGVENDQFSMSFEMSNAPIDHIQIKRHHREKLPYGWAYNQRGLIETDPEVALRNLSLVPLGGPEVTGGFKGSGLAFMFEILTAVLGGSDFGPNIPNPKEKNQVTTCYAAINPAFFCPFFEDRLSSYIDLVRTSEPINPELPVIVPGDKELDHMKKVEEQGGIIYSEHQLNVCQKLSQTLQVKPLIITYKSF